MSYTRREFGKIALAGIPVAGVLLSSDLAGAATAQAKVNSKFAGVQIGMNTPYNFKTGNNIAAEEVLRRTVEVGVSGIELRAQPVELSMGSPSLKAAAAAAAAAPARGAGGAARAGGGGAAARGGAAAGAAGAPAAAPGGRGAARAGAAGNAEEGGGGRAAAPPPSPEQVAAQRAAAEENKKWRLSAPMSKVREIRKMYNDAGVSIEIVKVDGLFNLSEDELDYFFTLAKNLGARALSAELPGDITATKRVGEFATKHKLLTTTHAHGQSVLEWEQAFSYSDYNGANVDIGHFTATQNRSPLPFIRSHHDRIAHIHVKDRKFGTNGGQNVSFGQGDTPIKEVLQAIRDNKWNIQATVEFEYAVPQGSDLTAELKKTVEYCRACLVA